MAGFTYLFLDTEWADAAGTELVSLALVSEDGHQRFYAERDPLSLSPSDFVRQHVYPLLDRGDAALPDIEFTTSLRAFLRKLASPYVLFDFPNDGALLKYAIAGFNLPEAVSRQCGPVPATVLTKMLRDERMTRILEDWFRRHPDAAARRHHAAVDADALRWAWLATTGRQALGLHQHEPS